MVETLKRRLCAKRFLWGLVALALFGAGLFLWGYARSNKLLLVPPFILFAAFVWVMVRVRTRYPAEVSE